MKAMHMQSVGLRDQKQQEALVIAGGIPLKPKNKLVCIEECLNKLKL